MTTPAMISALDAPAPLLFGAVQIDLPAHIIRVLDGAASLTFNGGTFTGMDSLFGVLDSISALSDGFGDEAPALQFSFLPNSGAAVADLTSPTAQGSRVRVWIGAVTMATGAVVADPILLFDGLLDQTSLTVGPGKRELDIDCVSAFERFFEVQEGVRLAPTFHKSVWPGELGLDNITGVTNTIYWGVQPPVGSVTGFYGGNISATGMYSGRWEFEV